MRCFLPFLALIAASCQAALLSLAGANLGTLQEDVRADFELTVKNSSAEELVLDGFRSGCGCISIIGSQAGQTLAPNAEVKLKIHLDGSRIEVGDFAKTIYAEVRGKPTVPFIVRGKIQRLFEVKPGKTLEIRGVSEVSQWERSFGIKLLRGQEKTTKLVVKTVPPQFDVTVKPDGDAGEFKIVVRPRLPMKAGHVDGAIEFEAPGYGNLTLRVAGVFIRPKFTFERSAVKLNGRDAVTVAVRIAASSRVRHATRTSGIDWQAVAALLRVQTPDGVKAQFRLADDGLALELSGASHSTAAQSVLIYYRDGIVGKIAIAEADVN